MSVDRHADGYEPNFDIDAAVGRQGELFCSSIAEGIVNGSVEVKTDVRALSTGRVYVEYECQRRSGWEKSGIATTSAEFWAFALGTPPTVLAAAPVRVIKESARRALKLGYRAECKTGSHPTKGALIPLNVLLTWALEIESA